ncbi:MAG: hypothetical protein ACJAVD_001403 [Porticoccaceae bacterium]|jgi:hypothetical protein
MTNNFSNFIFLIAGKDLIYDFITGLINQFKKQIRPRETIAKNLLK